MIKLDRRGKHNNHHGVDFGKTKGVIYHRNHVAHAKYCEAKTNRKYLAVSFNIVKMQNLSKNNYSLNGKFFFKPFYHQFSFKTCFNLGFCLPKRNVPLLQKVEKKKLGNTEIIKRRIRSSR